MVPPNNNQEIEIELLKRDVNMLSKLCEKMDTTIEKMQQVASDIAKIVSVQEQKFQMQDKVNEEVNRVLDKQQKEHTEDIKELNSKINKVSEDLTGKIEKTETIIIEEILKIKEELGTFNTNLNNKIGEIDMWRYMIMGGIALGVFILSEIVKFDITSIIKK